MTPRVMPAGALSPGKMPDYSDPLALQVLGIGLMALSCKNLLYITLTVLQPKLRRLPGRPIQNPWVKAVGGPKVDGVHTVAPDKGPPSDPGTR